MITNSKDGLGNLTHKNEKTSSVRSDGIKRRMTSDEREVLQDILVEYIENPRKMGTCITDIESLFREVHQRWNQETGHQVPQKKPKVLNKQAQAIIDDVCERYEIEYDALIGKRRSKYLITAREQICFAMHQAGFNFSEIGRAINRHPSTVIHTLKKDTEE